MAAMAKHKKRYLKPFMSLRRLLQPVTICAGSGGDKFFDNDATTGTLGKMGKADASTAVSRRFYDDESDDE